MKILCHIYYFTLFYLLSVIPELFIIKYSLHNIHKNKMCKGGHISLSIYLLSHTFQAKNHWKDMHEVLYEHYAIKYNKRNSHLLILCNWY
jgi:hypothetical protein